MIMFEYDNHLFGKQIICEEDIGRLHVQSSNVKSFWYKENKFKTSQKGKGYGILYIEFLSGAVYEYHRVPQRVVDQFASAPSYGKAVWRLIRGVYPYRRVRDVSSVLP